MSVTGLPGRQVSQNLSPGLAPLLLASLSSTEGGGATLRLGPSDAAG